MYQFSQSAAALPFFVAILLVFCGLATIFARFTAFLRGKPERVLPNKPFFCFWQRIFLRQRLPNWSGGVFWQQTLIFPRVFGSESKKRVAKTVLHLLLATLRTSIPSSRRILRPETKIIGHIFLLFSFFPRHLSRSGCFRLSYFTSAPLTSSKVYSFPSMVTVPLAIRPVTGS